MIDFSFMLLKQVKDYLTNAFPQTPCYTTLPDTPPFPHCHVSLDARKPGSYGKELITFNVVCRSTALGESENLEIASWVQRLLNGVILPLNAEASPAITATVRLLGSVRETKATPAPTSTKVMILSFDALVRRSAS